MGRTSCRPRAYSPIGRVLRITTDVTDARVVQPLVPEMPPVGVLNAPEAPSRNGGALGTRRDGRS